MNFKSSLPQMGIVLVQSACAVLITSSISLAAETVTIDNFIRAETDGYFSKQSDAGAFGKMAFESGPVPLDSQRVIRMNRDTIYGRGVFDLTHPVTIVKPDTGKRFQSMVVFNQDHYIKLVAYKPGRYKLTREKFGTRYVFVNTRTLVDPNDPADVAAALKAQAAIKWEQKDQGKLELPDWNVEQRDKLRAALLGLGPFVPDSKGMFGDVHEVDPVRRLLGAAGGWGGNREKDALYVNVNPKANDGSTPHALTVKDVPVDGFWSISLYNAKGFFEQNVNNANSVNNITAKKNPDGSVTVHFGGDPKRSNYLAIVPGWNYMVRLYQPRKEILDGKWKFPEAAPAK